MRRASLLLWVLTCLAGLIAVSGTLVAALVTAAAQAPDKREERKGLATPDTPRQQVIGALVFQPTLPAGYRLVYEQNFEKPGAAQQFVMTDPAAWKISNDHGTNALELVQQSRYQPAFRSPVNIALIADKIFGDFILEADLIQTGKEYGHRDMCLFFDVQSPTRFYYAHIATKADPNAHNIFIVNDAARRNFAKQTTPGANWGLGVWHKVRLERRSAEGTIKVFFDDLTRPIMTAEDKTFEKGYIGFGSFDDTGKIDNIKIWAPSVETKKTDFFKPGAK